MTTFLKKYFSLRKRNTLIAWEKAKQYKFCYAFLAPYAVLFLAFYILPMITSIYYSFTYYNILEPARFVGVQNYINLILQDEVFLTSVKNTFVIASRIDWVPYFEYMLDCVMNGTDIADDWTGTLANGAVKITAVGTAAAAGTQAKLDEVAAKLKDGSLKVFDCATFTVGGETLTSYMADVDDMGDFAPDTEAVVDGRFIESEKRSAPYFNVIIDGITVPAE